MSTEATVVVDQGDGAYLVFSPVLFGTHTPRIDGAKTILIISPRLVECFRFDEAGELESYQTRQTNIAEVATTILNQAPKAESRRSSINVGAFLGQYFDWGKIRADILNYRSWSSEAWVLVAVGTVAVILALLLTVK